MNNNSVLPNNLAKLTNKSLDAVNFSNDIYKIINNLEPNKAQGHDVLSIRMTELCENSICKQLSINLSYCLKEGKFLSDWKKAHLVAVHKKGVWECLDLCCRPISLLPICSKNFERLIYNELFIFFAAQQTFQRRFNVVFRLIWHRNVAKHQINVQTTLCTSTLKFTTLNNVKSTLSISTFIWTLDNVETTLPFST